MKHCVEFKLRLSVLLAFYPRVLKVFLSRTAQRMPYMTSWRVLRLLVVILLVVIWFLVAWTSAVCQNPGLSQALIAAGLTPEGLQFSMCQLDRWDYMMAVGEFLFSLGLYFCLSIWRDSSFYLSFLGLNSFITFSLYFALKV